MSNNNRTAIITGGTAGLGMELVHRLSERGWNIAFNGRRAEIVDQVAERVTSNGGVCMGIAGDVSDQIFVGHFMSSVFDTFGTPQLLVNNAAIFGQTGRVLETRCDDVEDAFATNVFGPLWIVRELVRHLDQKGYDSEPHCAVVNIGGAGIGGRGLEYSAFSYVASKASLVYLTEILATELADYDMTLNSLAPGALPTGFMDAALSDAIKDNNTRLIAEIENRRTLDTSVIYDKVTNWLEAFCRHDFRSVTGRLISAHWDIPDNVRDLVGSPDYFRLRRIDGTLFGPL